MGLVVGVVVEWVVLCSVLDVILFLFWWMCC